MGPRWQTFLSSVIPGELWSSGWGGSWALWEWQANSALRNRDVGLKLRYSDCFSKQGIRGVRHGTYWEWKVLAGPVDFMSSSFPDLGVGMKCLDLMILLLCTECVFNSWLDFFWYQFIMCFLGETCLTARMEMAIKTKSYFIISRCSLGKLYMAGNSRHESNSYNTSSIILIKEVSSEINYESRGEFFISSLSYCSGRHLIILRLSDCNVSYTYVKVFSWLEAYSQWEASTHGLCALLHRPPVWSEFVFATTIQLFFRQFFIGQFDPDRLLLCWVWEEKEMIVAYTFPNLSESGRMLLLMVVWAGDSWGSRRHTFVRTQQQCAEMLWYIFCTIL